MSKTKNNNDNTSGPVGPITNTNDEGKEFELGASTNDKNNEFESSRSSGAKKNINNTDESGGVDKVCYFC